MRALEGIRILDASVGPVAGVATAVLADFGAEVLHIEPPGGDGFRSLAASPLWLRGKHSLEVDLKSEAGQREAAALSAASDVVVVSGPPSRARRFGIDADAVQARAPGVVHASLTGYGPKGKWAEEAGIESLVAARAGRMQVFGRQTREDAPGFAALPVAQHACAMGAVQGIAAALYRRVRSGQGARVETSLLQGLLPYDLVDLLFVQLIERGVMDLPDPSAGDQPTLNYQPVRTADRRWIQCGNLMEHLFYAFLESIDLLPELLVDERCQDSPGAWGPDGIEFARDRILLRMQERTAAEWMETFQANGSVAAETYLSTEEAIGHRDLRANGEIVTVEDPERGPVRQIGPIARLSGTPGVVKGPAPRVGEGGKALAEAWRATPREAPTRAKTSASAPLADLLVVDFSTIIAGPLATSMLSDLGARVIKVEPPTGDPARSIIPGGGLALRMNGGKESLCLDLKTEEGRAIAQEWVTRADVVVHNFRSGVPERLGLGFDECLARNPRLLWAAIQGYGPDGPDGSRPATHPVVGAAMGGATWQAQPALALECRNLAEVREAARQIMRANEANPDPNTSSVLAAAITLALVARARGNGAGQRIDVSMLVANAWANVDDFVAYDGKVPRAALDPALRGRGVGERLYATRDGWLVLAIPNEAAWRRFAEATATQTFAEPGGRTIAAMEPLFASRSTDEWMDVLGAERVGCAPADGPGPGRFWATDAAAHENGFVPVVEHARHGQMQRWGAIVHVDGPPANAGAAPLAGQHTDALLSESGRNEAAIAQLRQDGIVASET